MQKHKKIFVTKPFLPPIEEYTTYISKIWENQYLTNGGPLVQELEEKLEEYFGVRHVLFVSSGTVALQLAIKALGITKEIITTPFSFAASTTVIIWQGCTAKFVDIDPLTFCLDPNKIEKAITPNTQAILPVHIYGYPCDIQGIKNIADKYNLKVIYDAAHTFGTKINNRSLVSFGDISAISFHATKLFHTGEGGAVVTNDDTLAEKIQLMRNFGIENDQIKSIGINGKNSELHAAMGLANLPHVTEIINKRKKISRIYDRSLQNIKIVRTINESNTDYNYAYYPIVFANKGTLMKVVHNLKREEVYAKRYFYPSLNILPYSEHTPCKIAESLAERVLCLPLYPDLSFNDAKRIARIVSKTLTEEKTPSPYHNDFNYYHRL